MRFLIDEDLPRVVSELLRKEGHEAVDVRDVGLRGSPDKDIAGYALETESCLLSGDLGFANIHQYHPSEYFGIVVLRLPADATSLTIIALLRGFISHPEIIGQVHGRLVIVEPGRIRVRR